MNQPTPNTSQGKSIPTNIDTKKCAKCGEVKPLDMFYKHPATRDKRLHDCMACQRRIVKEYFKTEKGSLNNIKKQKKQRAKSPHKWSARSKLREEVRKGTIIKPKECDNCEDDSRPLEGHHDDYDKPLDVIWLCPPCHKLKHGWLKDFSLIKGNKANLNNRGSGGTS